MKIKYWLEGTSEQNFGDALTNFFLEEVFTCEASDAPACRIIGSAIADFIVEEDLGPETTGGSNGPLVFWGAGLRAADSLSPKARARCVFNSVRGPLTKKYLALDASVPIGDPALLLPALYEPASSDYFRSKSICIPHFHDRRSDETLLAISGADAVLRPNIAPGIANIKEIIDGVCTADFVLSASLHGAVVAAAYGKPFGFWDPDYIDLPFKWADFAASIGIETLFARTVDEGRDLYQLKIQSRMCLPDMLPILKSAPFVVRPDALLRVISADHPSVISKSQLSKILDLMDNQKRSFSALPSRNDQDERAFEKDPLSTRPPTGSAAALEPEVEEILRTLKTESEKTARKLEALHIRLTDTRAET